MLRLGIDGTGVFLQMLDAEQASVKSHTAILPSVAELNSSVYLRDAERKGRLGDEKAQIRLE